MKKHKYDPTIVERLNNSEVLLELYMDIVARKRNNPLYYATKMGNGDYLMLCPLHREATPSMRFDSNKSKLLKCFGCGKSVSIVQIIKLVEGIHFRKAIKYALELYPEAQSSQDPDQLDLFGSGV